MSPPLPPSPPSGPPLGVCASRRNDTDPAPPSPPRTLRRASSTNPDMRRRIRAVPSASGGRPGGQGVAHTGHPPGEQLLRACAYSLVVRTTAARELEAELRQRADTCEIECAGIARSARDLGVRGEDLAGHDVEAPPVLDGEPRHVDLGRPKARQITPVDGDYPVSVGA